MSDEELKRLEALCERMMTEGSASRSETDWFVSEPIGERDYQVRCCSDSTGQPFPIAEVLTKADAEFIATARTAVPTLIAEIRRLRALVQSAVSWSVQDAETCAWCATWVGEPHKADCAAFVPGSIFKGESGEDEVK